jgi:hypothetical protein
MAVVDSQRTKSSAERIWEDAANGRNGMDKAAFVELMNGLWSGMGRTVMPDKTTLRVWYLCLHDLSVAQFGRAVQRYLTERSAEFVNVQMIRELSGAQQAAEEAPLVAWNEVTTEIRRTGGYQTPRFSDQRTTATIQHLGGWIRLCEQSPEELHKWTRQNFLKAFAAMPATAQARLTNLIELENARTGQVAAAKEVVQRIEQSRRARIE